MKLKFLFILLATSIFACKNEPTEQKATEETAASAATKTNAPDGKLVSVGEDVIMMEGTGSVTLPKVGDTSSITIFLVNYGQTMEGKTSLSTEGMSRAALLTSHFQMKGISHCFAVGNAAMQTLRGVAAENTECGFGLHKFDGSDTFLKTVLKNYRGKRVMVSCSPNELTTMLNQLTGNYKYQLPATEFDNFFVAVVRDFGNADIKHLKF